MNQIFQLQQYLDESANTVFFGGAGVSTESGIPDFRSEDGLYRQKYAYPPEQMLSRTFFNTHTAEFFQFYKDRVAVPDAQPNAAHDKLAALEKAGRLRAVITQNIDGLHQKAGSKNVLELHGSIHRNHCVTCGRSYSLAEILNMPGIPRCACGGIIKPDVVLYEEPLDQAVFDRAIRCIRSCDLMIIGGTSLVVYPAAGLVDSFHGQHLVVINRTEIESQQADLFIRAPIGKVFSQITVPHGSSHI